MTRPSGIPPARMRDYRIAAELRETPDLHRLAQLFIGMAMQRAEHDRATRRAGGNAGPTTPIEVESSTQEASG